MTELLYDKDVFSACAEVVPLWTISRWWSGSILRVRGGSSYGVPEDEMVYEYSPRARR